MDSPRFRLSEGPIDAEAVRRAVSPTRSGDGDDAGAAGAVVIFHGTVRNRTKGRRVLFLEYEAYAEMAVATLREVASDVALAHGLVAIACTHRVGRVEVGEDAVVLGVAAPHRGAALAAVEEFVARMKHDVPIWKKEHFEDGAVWVGTPDDPQGERAGRESTDRPKGPRP